METKEFKNLLKMLENLNTQQDRLLREQLEAQAEKKHVSRLLETPYEVIKCPHCESKNIRRWGKRNDLQRYRCKDCKRTFNSLTNTPLARLRRKGHWINYAECLKEGMSIRKSAKTCDIHPNTAFRWRHRFLQNATVIKPQLLEGIVEAYESFFRYSEKGSKSLNRPARKRGRLKRTEHIKQKFVCVMVSRDRHKNTLDSILNKLQAKGISSTLKEHLSKDALFCSDSRAAYLKFTQGNAIRHGKLNLSKGEQVKKDIVHLRHVIHYQNQLKHWILYHFRGVATKYLNNYLSWHRELDEFNFNITPKTLLLRAKSPDIYQHQPQMVT